jgi:cytochrome b6-f complex iron-sulfur subunit
MSLRVVRPSPTAPDCQGCSRRAVLRGFAMTAATVLVGCQGDSTSDPAPDAAPNTMTSMCGANVCLDLNDPANAPLTRVDGSMTITVPKDRIILIRTSTTNVQAVSDICTHLGCSVLYNRVNKILTCPCHGSQYQLTGTVIQGPATRALMAYQTQLDASTNLLTVML